MDYYVYVYQDPRFSGIYQYGKYQFFCEPFYVGKGRSWRFKNHLLKVKRGIYPNLPKFNVIKQILDSGYDPIIIKYKENLEENDAFLLEKDLIEKIGRKDLGIGPLRNLSNGGEGNGNRVFTEEHRKNISESKKGKCTENMKIHLTKIHENMKGNKYTLGYIPSKETKEKMSKSGLGKTFTEDHRKNISKSLMGHKGHKHSPETIERIKKNNTDKHRKNSMFVLAKNIESGEEIHFNNYSQASRYLNCSRQRIKPNNVPDWDIKIYKKGQ
jgi:hypothetical protein